MWSTSQKIPDCGPISRPLQELPEDLHSLGVSVIKIQHTAGDQVVGTIIPLKDFQLERLEDYEIPSLDFLSIFADIFLSWDQGSILAFIHAGFEVDVASKSALELKIHNFHNKVLLNQMTIKWLLKISIWNSYLLNWARDFSRARFSVVYSEQQLNSSTQIAPFHVARYITQNYNIFLSWN